MSRSTSPSVVVMMQMQARNAQRPFDSCTTLSQALPPELQIPTLLEAQPDYDKIVSLALELRGIKLKILNIPVPITVGPAFEGETIRKKDG